MSSAIGPVYGRNYLSVSNKRDGNSSLSFDDLISLMLYISYIFDDPIS